MLSIKPLKSPSKTTDYFFNQEDYYTKELTDNRDESQWHGKLSEKLQLNGIIKADAFESLLNGILPNGQQLGVKNGDIIHHRPGIDLTFSAPKSVSLLWQLGGDERLLHSHIEAVKQTLNIIEKECASARIFKNGKSEIQSTDNLLFALFHHDTSRALDPDMHTHAILMNMTERQDGKIRALASQSEYYGREKLGCVEHIFSRELHFGAIYRFILAELIRALGYEINITHQDCRFEIVGVPRGMIECFSKRGNTIKFIMSENGLKGGKAAQLVTMQSRPDKEYVEPAVLHARWKLEAEGFDFEKIVSLSKQNPLQQEPTEDKVNKAMNDGIKHLSEREAVFSQDELLAQAMRYTIGSTKLSELHQSIDNFVAKKWLIQSSSPGIPTYTTPRAIALETANLRIIEEMKSSVPAFLPEDKAKMALNKFDLTQGQYQAALSLFTTQDKVIGIQGFSGTGKTTMMKAVKAIADKEGIGLKGIVPTATATQKLQQESGIECCTVAQFLIEQKNNLNNQTNDQRVIWIIDESSMLSSHQFHSLLKLTKSSQAHCVFSGDKAQLPSPESGKPFTQAQMAMHTAILSEIVRQKPGTLMHEIVTDIIDGKIRDVLDKLNNHVEEIANKHERLEALCSHYFSLPPSVQKNTLVIIPANNDRKQVNGIIRSHFQEKGYIGKDAVDATVLSNKGLTLSEMRRVQNYNVGDTIRFNKSHKSLGIEKGMYAEVCSIDKVNNKLGLALKHKIIEWDARRNSSRMQAGISVFEKEKRALAVGDTILWTHNQKQQGMINSQKAEVLSVKKHSIKLKLADNKIITIDNRKSNHQHFDYAYALTAYGAEGQSCDYVIAHDESYRKKLTNLKSFYVIVSRAIKGVGLFIDDKKAYLSQLLQNSGEKTSSLELQATTKICPQSVVMKEQKTYYDIEKLQHSLNHQIQPLVEELLGKPNPAFSSLHTWRYGKKGSIAINVQGEKQGQWHNFESGEGGGLLQLIQKELGLTFYEACQTAAQWTGCQPQGLQKTVSKPIDKVKQPDDKDKREIMVANELWNKGKPIEKTLAEVYLTQHRGIHLPKWPSALKYLPSYYHQQTQQNYPALMVKATNEKDEVMAVQLILLDKITGNKASAGTNKIIRGRVKFGANVKFNEGNVTCYIAEGPETALSILMAKPEGEVIATLSETNFKKVNLATDKVTTFCLDNDGKAIDVIKLFDKIEQVKNPKLKWVMPQAAKTDFNDLLKAQGAKGVSDFINKNTQSFAMSTCDIQFDKLFEKTNTASDILEPAFQKIFDNKNARIEHNYANVFIKPLNIEKEL